MEDANCAMKEHAVFVAACKAKNEMTLRTMERLEQSGLHFPDYLHGMLLDGIQKLHESNKKFKHE